ncbi:ABC transporter ATP-binding protein [Allopusillimonas ginsengisoli]|uniref:ABC transporter ATP-binding protein n=1 Tax=Allopusillimonas ginsengisoli TaxID=453575 RepID=UPI0010C18609|nr:ATP-binding cassette domain-containing protein [Allopusillimonas ginsengisoli]
MNAPALLQVKDLTQRFGGIIANDHISFEVAQGSVTALIGPNGAGKTTVFNCVTGFYRASEGEIFFRDGDKQLEVGKLLDRPFVGGSHLVARAGIARTFQNIRLFKEMTVVENLLVAQHRRMDGNLLRGMVASPHFMKRENHALDEAYRWLDVMDLQAEANRLAGELSYGRQRRLEIARAMCTSPRLICLDEPAAGLNPNETELLSDLILELRAHHDVTVLLIEHDMGLVMDISDHVVVLDHGQVIARGDPDTVRNSPEVITAYLGADIEEAL